MHCRDSDPAANKRTQECGTSLVYVDPGRVANSGVSRFQWPHPIPGSGVEALHAEDTVEVVAGDGERG